ncbi:MAG: DEAD/DEAH box helicase [Treponema sp.]|nr:DEAD/DEAH box helicase [Treponema sp.]
MPAKKTAQPAIRFRFTPTLFAVDTPSYKGAFRDEPVRAFYDSAFAPKPAGLDDTGLFLYRIADKFVRELSRTEGLELMRGDTRPLLSEDDLSSILSTVPFSSGSEYVTADWLRSLWDRLASVFSADIAAYTGSVQMYLAEKDASLKVAERIFFHLVENKQDGDFPFSFLATYSTKDKSGGIRHAPLKYALTEYKDDRDKILALLSCLNRAGDVSPLINEFIQNGEMFHPLRLTAQETYGILKSIPAIEETGIVCRIPDWWKKGRQKARVSVKLEKKKSILGLETILSMDGYLEADGERLSKADIKKLLSESEGLALIKGKWIEVDHERLKALLARMEQYHGDITMLEALRMGLTDAVSGTDNDPTSADEIVNGEWLSSLLHELRSAPSQKEMRLPASFRATLRPYQENGWAWLSRMSGCRLGACLADDMGLGKTVQLLAHLETLRTSLNAGTPEAAAKALLVVPASLLGNWQNECRKFAPELPVEILHSSAKNGQKLEIGNGAFLYITTYSMVSRLPELAEQEWDTLILDEAQAIKNPSSKQTKAIKSLRARSRIALTGTPIENDLTNLWSLFDFLDKGLLGTATEFKKFCKSLENNPAGYAKLKAMILPFMLRRLKTDKSIISDLPDKMEMTDHIALSKKQRVLYKKYTDDIARILEESKLEDNPMKRRGLVLASLMKLKQICNHPDQFNGQEAFAEGDSGKFEYLRELCETIYEKRERVLVFTQFKEICGPLDEFLSGVFGIRGFVLHGGTSVAKRNQMVEEFQGDTYIPYMVISVKAGGTGLNLTNANHVVHFDRWWNPAVENQATDRAFRIGQKKNVMVHKFVCTGTVEEKIDELIRSKTELTKNVIGTDSGENWITEMSDDELMKLFTLEA